MITVNPAAGRFSADHGWLQSNFSFSFAEYRDPDNMHFGPLRVLNDDFIAPLKGFGSHPHKEMEIVSVVLKGELQHQDSTGNREVIRYGEVQRMTAGTGIVHSEMNPSANETVNLLQLWFMPNEQGLQPSYEQIAYNLSAMKNRLLPVVSNKTHADKTAFIHQDLTLYLSELEAGQSLTFRQEAGRRIYLFVIEGELTLNGEQPLGKRDAARINGVEELSLQTAAGASFMLIDLP